MFYFGGDNELAPIVIPQLKAIKDAGFEENTDVVVYYDANQHGVPTRLYNVNKERREEGGVRRTRIGDGEDSFVRNMKEDEIDPQTLVVEGHGDSAKKMAGALKTPDTVKAGDALETFIAYCLENHPAKHYMLFLVGHGMIVGNDAFLPDSHPVSAIKLIQLGKILDRFKKGGGALELLAMHSCSMSSLEVAYQLRGKARYLMASEGISFVGSWHYRQVLKKAFKVINSSAGGDINVGALAENLFELLLHSGKDYMLAGYSVDLALCSLAPHLYTPLKTAIEGLVAELIAQLDETKGTRGQEAILLAHWDAQSFWGETYTDLFDFCLCLQRRCNGDDALKALRLACGNVMVSLGSDVHDGVIQRSENFGTEYQFARGLSVFFPWSRPVEAADNGPDDDAAEDADDSLPNVGRVLRRYRRYLFTTEFAEGRRWLDFLEAYFVATQRKSLETGEPVGVAAGVGAQASTVFNVAGALSRPPLGALPMPSDGKPTPSMGVGCGCPSIKNYPVAPVTDVRGRRRLSGPRVYVSKGIR